MKSLPRNFKEDVKCIYNRDSEFFHAKKGKEYLFLLLILTFKMFNYENHFFTLQKRLLLSKRFICFNEK